MAVVIEELQVEIEPPREAPRGEAPPPAPAEPDPHAMAQALARELWLSVRLAAD